MMRYTRVESRMNDLRSMTKQTRRSLRLWRWIFYVIGLAAVVTAGAAGVSSLGDIWGSTAIGVLALAAAVLTAVDRFIGASEKAVRLDRRWQSLQSLETKSAFILHDAVTKESMLDPRDRGADAAYDTWLNERCRSIDEELAEIDDRQDQV